MQIPEIKRKKEQLKKDLLNLIYKFEEETETTVQNIYLSRIFIEEMSDYDSRTEIQGLDLEVRII